MEENINDDGKSKIKWLCCVMKLNCCWVKVPNVLVWVGSGDQREKWRDDLVFP